MFAKKSTETVEIENEIVTIGRLSAFQLDEAAELQMQKSIKQSKQLGGDFIAAIRDPNSFEKLESRKKNMTPEEKRNARYDTYDRKYVLENGIISWTCLKPDGKTLPISEGVKDLIESAANILFHRIIDFSCGPVSEDEAEREQKKD